MADPITLCRLAAASYEGRPQPPGASLIREIDRWGTAAFVWRLPGEIVVSFRGTDSLLDGLMDIRYAKTDFPEGGRVHSGFLAARRVVWGDLLSVLDDFPSSPLSFAGHSLGGALAILSAASFPRAAAVTFGAPRVGNAEFAALLAGRITRYENRCDLVTFVPAETYNPGQILWALANGRRPTGYAKESAPIILPGRGHSMAAYLDAVTAHPVA